MSQRFRFTSIFILRGLTTITIPWWRVPRCLGCNRILWGHIPTNTVREKTWCWDCEREHLMNPNSTLDLRIAFGEVQETSRCPESVFTSEFVDFPPK
jgi:hypothetical protein